MTEREELRRKLINIYTSELTESVRETVSDILDETLPPDGKKCRAFFHGRYIYLCDVTNTDCGYELPWSALRNAALEFEDSEDGIKEWMRTVIELRGLLKLVESITFVTSPDADIK